MAGKGKRKPSGPRIGGTGNEQAEKPLTLKDMLGAETIDKLRKQAEAMKLEEAKIREAKRAEAEAAREAERKRQEQDFGFLLNQSDMDWKKYK